MSSSPLTPLPGFERVYREQFDFVLRTLRALGVSSSALDDAVQDVFIVVHRRLPEFEGRASVKTWAYEIARRVALRYRTRAAREAAHHAEFPGRLAGGTDLDDMIERAHAAEVLQRFLADLDEDRRRAFVLAELWEMSGREIAESLGVNMNTVYARIRSARTELDRLAHRLQVRDVGAATRSLREQRASTAARERARVGILAGVGSAASSGTLGLATLAWAGLGVVACAAGVTAAVRLAAPHKPVAPVLEAPSRVEVRVETEAIMPTEVQLDPASVPAPVDPGPATVARPSRPRSPKSVEAKRPSLSEEVAAVRSIRAAVQAEDVARARQRIASYRDNAPRGVLMDEVDALDVELSCRVQAPAAAAQLKGFAKAHRGSSLVERLTVLCSSKIGPQEPRSAGTQGS